MAARDDLERQIENWIGPTIQALESKERKKLASAIGLAVAKSNRERIKAQVDPEGRRFVPRKEKKPINKPVKFLYEKPGGMKRVGSMVSFRDEGDRMIGYDRQAGGIRTFLKSRVKHYMRPDSGGGGGSRVRGRRGAIRRKAMFTHVRKAKHLRMLRAGANGVAIGFSNNVAAIAANHQYGSRLRMEHNGAMAKYPERRLLGLSSSDIEMIHDMVLDHVTGVKR